MTTAVVCAGMSLFLGFLLSVVAWNAAVTLDGENYAELWLLVGGGCVGLVQVGLVIATAASTLMAPASAAHIATRLAANVVAVGGIAIPWVVYVIAKP
jgi:hypothetical protein